MSLDKLGAMGVSLVAGVAPSLFTNDLTTPVLGVQLTTVAGAILGTYATIGFDDTQRPRGRMFSLAVSTVILASALVGWLPKALGWHWSSGNTEAALAVGAALAVYFALPPAIKRSGELIREFKLSDLLPFRKSAPPPVYPPPDGPPGAGPSEGPPDK